MTVDQAPIDCDNCPKGSDCTECVDVVFLEDSYDGDVFAVFPALASSAVNSDLLTCYAHSGQHGGASPGYCNGCAEVTDPAKYADIATELVRIGYALFMVSKSRMGSDAYAAARQKQLRMEGCNG
jgi:hypothetical protein